MEKEALKSGETHNVDAYHFANHRKLFKSAVTQCDALHELLTSDGSVHGSLYREEILSDTMRDYPWKK